MPVLLAWYLVARLSTVTPVSRSHILVAMTNFGSPKGVTKQDHLVLGLWHVTYYFAIPIGVIVLGLILWCAFRYRKRPGQDEPPRQFQYHIPLEIFYTVVPVLIVAVLFGFTAHAEHKEDHVSKHPALVVKVNGFQWGWRFIYPNGHQQFGSIAGEPSINDGKALPILYLPEHETVQLDLKTLDVNHSFYVPEFLFKRDLIHGIKNTVDFNIEKTGKWIGECTQFCGTYHSFMRFWVVALPPKQFNSWYAHQAPNSITTYGA